MNLKLQLHQHCQEKLLSRRTTIETAIGGVEESMRQEGKSTAGDKHNTARANMQLERERLGNSLKQIDILLMQLKRIPTDGESDPIRMGSLVKTTAGSFYMAVPVDLCSIEGEPVYCVGPKSPVAQELLGKSNGQSYSLNGQTFTILKVD